MTAFHTITIPHDNTLESKSISDVFAWKNHADEEVEKETEQGRLL